MSRAERDEREAAKHEKKVQWLSYKFERYREDGTDTAKRPTRAEWGKRKLPVPADHRNGIQVALGPVEFEPCVGPAVLPDLDNTGSADDLPDARDRAAVEKLHDLQTWFNGTDIHYQKVLGYGSSNLALHYKFGSGPGATDFVLKVALGNPREDPRIRKEAEILRKVRRSQHIVQTISPRDIGKAARTDARPQPPDDDSSGVEEKSSGDESAPSDNGPEPRTKRRKRDEGELRDRSKGVRRRRREYKRARRDREAAADAADPLQNRDFLLLEYMENGDLESLIQRLNERKQTCPNRVLWSFWVCRKLSWTIGPL